MTDADRTVVFLGPSLDRAAAAQILPARYRPPARKGDVYALLTANVRRIVVIDGTFHSHPSLWQRELLEAVDEGIEVIGASSMGALRAAELYRFGMVGVGTVFEWYRSGFLDGDDEVALQHASEEYKYRALSEPLVNIRFTLQQAVRDRQLTADEEQALIAFLKGTHYPGRSYSAMLSAPIARTWLDERRQALMSYVRTRAVDIKAHDARRALEHCARTPIKTSPRPQRAAPWSREFRHVSLAFRSWRARGATIAWDDVRRGFRASRVRWRTHLAEATVSWCLLDLAHRGEVTCPEPERLAIVSSWTRQHRVRDPVAWARARGLTWQDYTELLAQHTLTSWLRGSSFAALGIARDRDAAAKLARLLPRTLPAGVRGDDVAILSRWLAVHGFACPVATQARMLAAWGLQTPARRRAAARSLALSYARFNVALDERIAGSWLVVRGLVSFGAVADLETAALLRHQFYSSIDEILVLGRRR